MGCTRRRRTSWYARVRESSAGSCESSLWDVTTALVTAWVTVPHVMCNLTLAFCEQSLPCFCENQRS
jgi:hypothetical protein